MQVKSLAVLVDEGLYSALLREIELPELKISIFDSVERLVDSLEKNARPDMILEVMGSGLSSIIRIPSALSRLANGAPVSRLNIEQGQRLALVHPVEHLVNLEKFSLEILAKAIHDLIEVAQQGALSKPRLTATQLTVLKLVAEGKSNTEIALHRKTSLRNTEAIIARTFHRLGVDPKAGVRAKVLAANDFVSAQR